MHIISILGSNDSYSSVFLKVTDGKHYFRPPKKLEMHFTMEFQKHQEVTVYWEYVDIAQDDLLNWRLGSEMWKGPISLTPDGIIGTDIHASSDCMSVHCDSIKPLKLHHEELMMPPCAPGPCGLVTVSVWLY